MPILEAGPQNRPSAASLPNGNLTVHEPETPPAAVRNDVRVAPPVARAVQLALFLPLGIAAVPMLVYLLGVDFGPLEGFMAHWAFLILEVGAAVACLSRAALVREERRAWTMLGIGVALWALGDAYYRAVLYESEVPPVPSPADAFWLCFYPFAYTGIALLIRARARDVRATVWIDGLIAALAVAAVAAAVVFNAVLAGVGGEPLQTATSPGLPADGHAAAGVRRRSVRDHRVAA